MHGSRAMKSPASQEADVWRIPNIHPRLDVVIQKHPHPAPEDLGSQQVDTALGA
ncbi:hypothetical protein PAXRUDRAFT_832722 [Paxillus rubicundulus Ve08.2h10]|uniref:Uncharacterized protein n=1 Tax=Paxillus rubicundulus Ve08.2h10 TaxID=930991 RepID=A0A0D0DBX2_9AGAM|nr:hypothetical protein PAXRUDRAFT_832722 [Paxillus rubicundulus Ve08.2h10]